MTKEPGDSPKESKRHHVYIFFKSYDKLSLDILEGMSHFSVVSISLIISSPLYYGMTV